MSVTIKDVAAVVGVSSSTVSRAFSRPEKVDSITRDRIMEAAATLGYRPNRAAQALNTGRSMCLGAVLPDIENPYFASMLKGIEQAAGKLGYQVLVTDTGEDVHAERRALQELEGRVDGLVHCSPRLEDEELVEFALRTPTVLTNRSVPGLPHVNFDNASGIRQAATHLRGLGHRHIGYVSGDLLSRSARQRLEAFRAVADAERTHGVEAVLLGTWPPTFEGGAAAADEALASQVSAVIVYNDLMAIGLVQRLLGYGIVLPDRLSVVGFDGIPLGGMITPALTTVATPRVEAGRMAARALHDLVVGERNASEIGVTLPTTLVVRRSASSGRSS